VGIADSEAPLVAFTDDDCRVPADWLGRIVAHFSAEPETAVLFGRVRVPNDLPADAFAASFEAEVLDCKADLSGGFRSFGIAPTSRRGVRPSGEWGPSMRAWASARP
jgi:hypothetical protein